MTLYWRGDMNHIVRDLIECWNGAMPHPDTVPRCRHSYTLYEWGAYVTLTYPRSWVGHWRKLRAVTKHYILQFCDEQKISNSQANDDKTNKR